MSGIPSLFLSADAAKEVADAVGWNLKIPESAAQKGTRYLQGGVLNDKYQAYWTEPLEITGATIVPQTINFKDGTVMNGYQVQVKTRVLDGQNSGKPVTVRANLDPSELAAKGVESAKRKMTQMSCGKLNELLRSVGFDVTGMGVNYTEYFYAENGGFPVVTGMKANAKMKHHVDGGREYQETQGFAAYEGSLPI